MVADIACEFEANHLCNDAPPTLLSIDDVAILLNIEYDITGIKKLWRFIPWLLSIFHYHEANLDRYKHGYLCRRI